MKWTATLPPAAALIAGLLWTGRQHQLLHGLRGDQDTLRHYIAAAHQEDAASADEHDHTAKNGGLPAKKKLDWKKILETQGADLNGMRDVRLMMEIQKTVLEMSDEELIAQIEEIKGLDGAEGPKLQLESILMQALGEKNPKLMFEKFSDQLKGNQAAYWFNSAFQKWLKQDAGTATQWLDQKIADGTFESKSLDGKNQSRIMFENTLVGQLIDSDPSAAQTRVMKMGEDERSQFFETIGYQMKPGSEAAIATIARAAMPADKEADAVANLTLRMRDNYGQLDGFIKSISATSAEKDAIVGDVFSSGLMSRETGTFDVAKLDGARTWAATQSPGTVETLTGRALGNQNPGQDFETNAQLAVKYAAQSNNDDLMTEFLGSSAAMLHPDQALALLDSVKDPGKRSELQNHLQDIAKARGN